MVQHYCFFTRKIQDMPTKISVSFVHKCLGIGQSLNDGWFIEAMECFHQWKRMNVCTLMDESQQCCIFGNMTDTKEGIQCKSICFEFQKKQKLICHYISAECSSPGGGGGGVRIDWESAYVIFLGLCQHLDYDVDCMVVHKDTVVRSVQKRQTKVNI